MSTLAGGNATQVEVRDSSIGPGAPRRWQGRISRHALIQLAVAVALLALAAWQLNVRDVAGAFADVRYQWLGPALSVYIAARFVNAWEWRLLLTKVGSAPVTGLFGTLLVGSLVNSLIPGNLGDVAKVQIVANRYGLSRTGIIGGRGAEAVVNGMMFTGFVALSLTLEGSASPRGDLVRLGAQLSTVAFMIAVAASRLLPRTLPDGRAIQRLPLRFRQIAENHWPRFHDGFEVIRRPRLLGLLLMMNVGGWLVDILINWSYGRAFNLDLSFSAYLSITVMLALITTFPVTVGNIGSWEVGIVAVLALHGVPPERALAYAVGVHVFNLMFNVALGLIAMRLMGLELREVFALRSQRGLTRPGSGQGMSAPSPPVVGRMELGIGPFDGQE